MCIFRNDSPVGLDNPMSWFHGDYFFISKVVVVETVYHNVYGLIEVTRTERHSSVSTKNDIPFTFIITGVEAEISSSISKLGHLKFKPSRARYYWQHMELINLGELAL